MVTRTITRDGPTPHMVKDEVSLEQSVRETIHSLAKDGGRLEITVGGVVRTATFKPGMSIELVGEVLANMVASMGKEEQ